MGRLRQGSRGMLKIAQVTKPNRASLVSNVFENREFLISPK